MCMLISLRLLPTTIFQSKCRKFNIGFNRMSEQEQKQEPLALPAAETATRIDVSQGETFKLDSMGPVVVNKNGTLSRIANWQNMTDLEKENTLRVLGKRNMLRQEKMKAEEQNAKLP